MGWRDPRRHGLHLAVRRLHQDGQYETLITRDDGVSYGLRGVGHMFAIPHDVAHFVVEKALGLDEGFWGTIAQGAVLPTMHYRGGRRAPKAAERSHSLLKANVRRLAEAEVLVRLFNDRFEQGHGEDCPRLRALIDDTLAAFDGWRRAIGQREIVMIHADYAHLLSRWKKTAAGAALDLRWD